MKILWLATCDSFYDFILSNSNICHSNDGGWYIGLHQAILKHGQQSNIKLGIAFTCSNKQVPFKTCIDNCTYYPLIRPHKSILKKLSSYLIRKMHFEELWSEEIDKIIDDVIREKINIPHKFRMRLESRHCVESRIIYFRFRVLDKACLQCNVFLKGLSEEMKEALSDERIDFAVIYEGIQGSQQDTDTDDKDGFCGSQPQVPFLADGACPVR